MSDLIYRQAAIDEFEKELSAKYNRREFAIGFVGIKSILENLPSAQPKRGKWTKENACEFCGYKPWYERDIHTLNYCPNCGADMRGEEDGK